MLTFQLTLILGGKRVSTESATQPSSEIVAEVDALFCGAQAPYGTYTRSRGDPGEVIVPDTMYRFALVDQESQAVSLQVYKGINTIGGALWTREVRAMLKVSARGHPAIPNILAGAYIEKHDLAYVITEAASYRLSDEGAMAFVANRPEEALRQLAILAHGLSLLHEQGITHQNLQPGAIEYLESSNVLGAEEDGYTLRLSRFEMSAMVSNLVRRQLAGEKLPQGDLRRIYLDSAKDTLAYCPPERAEWLLRPEGEGTFLESDRSDVYSLGVLAWRWLVESADPLGSSGSEEPIQWAGAEPSLDAVRALNRQLRGRLRTHRLPRTLADLLGAMLAWDPRERPSIVAVLRDISQDYGRLVASLAPPEENRVYYVGFMPVPSKATIYKWGWIDQDPEDDEGREQLRAFLETELRGAEILYCPEGFSGYQRARNERELKSYQAAKYVLVGKQAYWFCDVWSERGPAYSRDDRRVEQLLVIKYVRHHNRAWRLGETPLRRQIPGEMRLIPVWTRRALDLSDVRAQGTSWQELLDSVKFERSTPPWMQVMDDALSFLLEFRGAELDARLFPFEVIGCSGEVHNIRVDVPRDRRRQYSNALRSLYFREMRTPMGRLFQSLDGEATSMLAIYADDDGRPGFRGGPIAKAVFDRWLDDDTVAIRVVGGRRGPIKFGWIRPDEDQGSFSQLRNQEDAVEELLRARALLHQLHSPMAIKGIRHRWRDVGKDLAGRSPDIVKDMLTSEPFYALHGPPGTGKTTVASVAVAANLRADPSQRILISSQSHYALDNLARGVLKRCRADGLHPVAVRVASLFAQADHKIHPSIEHLLPERQASAMVERIQRSGRAALENGHLDDGYQLDDALKGLLAEWIQQAPRVELETRDRLRRGANLVFATTGACTARNVATGGTSGLYDWVIVEEAARAWPTELALPLVRGLRWTLIGDHFQLPAFDELSVMRFLEACMSSSEEELQVHGEHREAYLEVFSLFGSLFDKRAVRRARRPKSTRLVEPLDELDLQFRMHPDICRVVSKAFYRTRTDPLDGEKKTYEDGWLRTHDESTNQPHGLHAPAFLKGRAVVWLDTEGVQDTNDQRAWRNEGEAKLIRRMLSRIRPKPQPPARGDDDDTFALLSPYNAQITQLKSVGLPGWTDGRIHTVDSFQGREADVVVVSLVRSTQRDDQRPEANIGYLVSPNRVNVLLSRARQLLVIVGRLSHFEQQVAHNPDRRDIHFWRVIAEEIRRQGAVVPAATQLKGGSL